MKKLLVAVLITLACACRKNETPLSRIEKGKFEAMYIDLLDSAQTIQSTPGDSSLSPVAQRILQRHGVTQEQFKETMHYYNTDTRKWKEFYLDVTKRIDTRTTNSASP